MVKFSRKLNIVLALLLIAMLIGLLDEHINPVIASGSEWNSAGNDEKTVVVGFFEDDNPSFITGLSDNDRKSGFAYEYIRDIARSTGWKYEYVYGSWNEIYSMLLNGQIDMVPGVSYSEDRLDKLMYADTPMMEKQFYIYAPKDSKINISNTASLKGMKIAARANSIQFSLLRDFVKEKGLNCILIEMATEEECRKAVESGEVDAYVSSTTHIHDELESYFYVGKSDCYTVFALGREEIKKDLDAAVSELFEQMPHYTTLLAEKYFNEYSVGRFLNDEEKAWLKNKIFLRVGITKNDLPLSALDKDGKPIGVAGEIVSYLENYLGIPVRVVGFDSSSMLENAVVNSDVDMAFPVFCDIWYSEKGGYLITNPVISEKAVLVYKGDLTEDKFKTVAMGMTTLSQRYLVEMHYPNAEKKVYSSRKEYLNAILEGKAGFAIGSSSVITRFIQEYSEYSELKLAPLDTDIKFGFAIAPENHQLIPILNKAIRNLEDNTAITEALIKYSVVKKKATFSGYVKENPTTVVLSALVLFFIVIVIVLILRDRFHVHKRTIEQQEVKLGEAKASLEEALRHEVEAKTELARALSDQNVIYSELLRMESGGVVAVDWDTRKLVTVNEAALHIFGFKSEEEALGHDSGALLNSILEEVREETRQKIISELDDKGTCIVEVPVAINGETEYYLLQAALRALANGQRVCLISITDITESKKLELELQTASRIDALSEVYNRGWGEKMINDAMQSGNGGMFCLLDINKFKLINDNYGHQNGDKAIKVVASTLMESFRDQDVVMRLGGDEFAVFAIGVKSKEEGAAIINRFFAKLFKKRIPEMDDRPINVALGACICGDNNMLSFDDMYRMADSQMYKCKEKQESSFIFF